MKKLLLILSIAICGIANAQAPQWGWSKTPAGNEGVSTCTDANGNIYVTGNYSNNMAYCASTYSLTLFGPSGTQTDVFVAKHDSKGNVLWAKCGGGAKIDLSYGISVDANGNVYVTGNFESNTVLFGSITLTNSTTSGNTDMFIVKYDSNGNMKWAKKAGGVNDDSGSGVGTDANGNVYISGMINNNALIKYDSLGNVNWTAVPTVSANGISVNPDGNIYITGIYSPGYYIAKYDTSGNMKWFKSPSGGEGYSVSTDTSSNVYVSGIFGGTAIMGNDTLVSAGSWDDFIAKFDTAGNISWAKRIGGTNTEYINSSPFPPIQIVVDPTGNGNSYVLGRSLSDTIIVDNDTLLKGPHGNLIFVIKYNSSGIIDWYINPPDANGRSNGINVDANQNVYLTGWLNYPLSYYSSAILNTGGGYLVKLCNMATPVPVVTQVGNVLTSTPANIYQWYWLNPSFYNSPVIINGETSQSFTVVNTSLAYVVTVKDTASGCDATSAPAIVTPINVNENEISNLFSIFPNPASGTFSIQSSEKISSLEIINVLGEKVFTSTINHQTSAIDLSSQPNGIYFIQIKTEEGTVNKKIVISH